MMFCQCVINLSTFTGIVNSIATVYEVLHVHLKMLQLNKACMCILCWIQICRFCWHRIRTNENGLCPACRKV